MNSINQQSPILSEDFLNRYSGLYTEVFLKSLSNSDEFNFRTFNEGDFTNSHANKLRGSLEKHKSILQKHNSNGSGIFVVINEGGQRANEINRIRAVFADTDGAPLEPLMSLQPHMVIESSPQKWHVYWLVKSNFPLEKFKPTQQAIAAKFGTDKSVSDLSRVMRLPGFYHQKSTPFLTKIIHYSKGLPRYEYQEIFEGLGLEEKSGGYQSTAPLIDQLSIPSLTSFKQMEKMLSCINPECPRDDWSRVGFAIADEYGESGRKLFIDWSAGKYSKGADHDTK